MRIIRFLPVCSISLDRIPMDAKTLRFALEMKAGGVFPPIKVALAHNGCFEIRDGRHRLAASKLAGRYGIMARYGRADEKS